MEISEAVAYLEKFRLGDGKYLIGVFEPGMTIFKQQIRALNIFYCLYLTKEISASDGQFITIIGGGIAGLTFASAALKSKIKVQIVEQHPTLLPIQSGCTNRPIHPRIYDWPDDGSTNANASLPVLSWNASNTDKFCETLLTEYQNIKKYYSSVGSNIGDYLKEIFNVKEIERISQVKKGYNLLCRTSESKNKILINSKLIIYAVGYGIEKSVELDTPSYWRNIESHQVHLKVKPKNYFISGTGDGGFMDLFTILLTNINSETLVNTIIEVDSFLVDKLKEIKRNFLRTYEPEDHFMFDAYETISKSTIKKIVSNLPLRLEGIKPILNGRKSFRNSLNYGQSSLLNSFLAYALKTERKFSYVKGESVYDKPSKTCYVGDKKYVDEDYIFLFRTGPDTDRNIDRLPSLRQDIKNSEIVAKQKNIPITKKTPTPLWTHQDFKDIFEQGIISSISTVCANALPLLEYFTNQIKEDLITSYGSKCPHFRIAVHKLIHTNGKFKYQQITAYAGTKANKFSGGFGKLFPQDEGSVGYTFLSGKPTLIVGQEDQNDTALIDYFNVLNIPDAIEKVAKAKSYFSFPIKAKVKTKYGSEIHIPNLVIYIDSESSTFFNKTNFDEIILRSVKSFKYVLESSLKKNQINMNGFNTEVLDDYLFKSNLVIEKNDFFQKDNIRFNDLVDKVSSQKVFEDTVFNNFLSFTN